MDGMRTLKEIWETACERLGDDMPTQDEVIGLLSQLHRADALQSDMPPDISDLHQRHVRWQRSRWLGALRSPLAVRLPILDPERFLERTMFLVRPFLGWAGFVLWCSVVFTALILISLHWKELTSNLADRIMSMENLLLLWIVYPVVKTLHEFGHAYTVKRFGGEVHEMGIMILVFMPVPYVDASSSTALTEKRKRILVGAAGILVELFLAAIAAFVWVNVEPGSVRAVAFNVMLIAGVSTLFFNGNPLLRFDAYYVLSDYLEIPNLGSRSNQYIGYLLKRYVLGIVDVQAPLSSPGEAFWMVFYALASFVYRIFITIRIALFVAGKFFIIGVVIAAWGIFSMTILPLTKVVHSIITDVRIRRKRVRIILSCIALSWVPEESRIHAGTEGFILEVVASPGKKVHSGDLLVKCDNADLTARVKILEASLGELDARYRLSLLSDRTETEILRDEIKRVEAELSQTHERLEGLMVRSASDGIFIMPDSQDMPGRFVSRGAPLGYVADFSHAVIRAVVNQDVVDRIRNRTIKVEARLAEDIEETIPAVIVREIPAASSELPSLALSLEGGGTIALDPREKEEAKAFEKFFQFEIALYGTAAGSVGERVFIRFEHGPEPLAYRWYRSIRGLLLKRFDV
jgi:putative peptide zinc metalloprotease protein